MECPKSPKGGSKSDFLFFKYNQLQWNKVCYKVSLCEYFQQILFRILHSLNCSGMVEDRLCKSQDGSDVFVV